jgi:hypothetical protein
MTLATGVSRNIVVWPPQLLRVSDRLKLNGSAALAAFARLITNDSREKLGPVNQTFAFRTCAMAVRFVNCRNIATDNGRKRRPKDGGSQHPRNSVQNDASILSRSSPSISAMQ